MGLFDKVKESAKSAGVETKLQELGIKMDHLQVQELDGKTLISGTVANEEDMKKIKSTFGGVFGGVNTIIDVDVVQHYTVQDGDSPWGVAQKFWGDGNKYPYLVEANDGKESFYTGDVLKVPSLKSYIGGHKLQAILESLGYSVGTIDGVIGANTQQAIKKFQQEESLETTGQLNDATRRALRLNFKNEVKAVNGAALQAVLKELGHNPGAIDGQVGANTIKALKSFQNETGVEATGSIDDATIKQFKLHLV